MPRLTLVCGCPGVDLTTAVATACRVSGGKAKLFDVDAETKGWIKGAIDNKLKTFKGWNVDRERFAEWLEGQSLAYFDDYSFERLDRHARPVTEAIAECVASHAIAAFAKGEDVVISGHIGRDDRHVVIAAFEDFVKTAVPEETQAAMRAAKLLGEIAGTLSGKIASASRALLEDKSLGKADAILAMALEIADIARQSAEYASEAFSRPFMAADREKDIASKSKDAKDIALRPAKAPPLTMEGYGQDRQRAFDVVAAAVTAAETAAKELARTCTRAVKGRGTGSDRFVEDAQAVHDAIESARAVLGRVRDDILPSVASAKTREQRDTALRALAALQTGGKRASVDDDDDIDSEVQSDLAKYDIGGTDDDDDDELERRADLEAKAAADKEAADKAAAAAAKQAELERKKPSLLVVEVTNVAACPISYEHVNDGTDVRPSTIAVLERSGSRYAMGPPWVHNLASDADADAYGTARDAPCDLKNAVPKNAVWEHVKKQLYSGSADRSYGSDYGNYGSYGSYGRYGYY